jgi:hypothetical protein
MSASPTYPLTRMAAAVLVTVACTNGFAKSAGADNRSFEWVSAGGSQGGDKTRAITVDMAGNVYIAGEISGPADFGKHALESQGKMDAFVAKLSPSGEFLWAKSFGGAEVDRAYGVAADDRGNVYVCGHFQSTDLQIKGATQTNHGEYDLFVLKLNSAGELLWGRTSGGAGYDYAHAIVLDAAGDIVVTGAVAGQAVLGSVTLNDSSKDRSIFIAKYSTTGDLKWARCTTGISGGANAVGIDAQGQIYVGGSFAGQGRFDTLELNGAKGACGCVLKMTGDGAGLKAVTFPGTAPTVHEIAVDAQGRVWAAGMFKQNIKIGSHELTSSSASNSDGFCAALDADLNVNWVKNIQGEGVDYCLGVATDGSGGSFFTGEFTSNASLDEATFHSAGGVDIFIAAFDATGRLLWSHSCGSEKTDNAYSTAWHQSGSLLLGGACAAVANFGAHSMTSPKGSEAYAAKMKVR